MLNRYLKINNTIIPNPINFSETPQFIETVNQSEAGSDLIAVTRAEKLVLTMTFNLSSFWLAKLKTYSQMLQVTLNYNGVDYIGRFRPATNTLQPGSEKTKNTNGLFACQFTFTEI